MYIWLWIAIGGAVGACARFGVNQLFVGCSGWPIATLLVNAIGSGLMGGMMSCCSMNLSTDPIKLGVIIGVLGSYTTFSTFSYETWLFIQQGAWLKAGLHILSNVLLCLLMMGFGHTMGKFFTH